MIAPRVILASQSPRRRELLTLIGIPHEVRPADIDEAYLSGEHPRAHCERLAREKATVVARDAPDALVIGSDTIVVVDGDVLGKPRDDAQAAHMLTRLSGRSHVVMTAVAVQWRGDTRSAVEEVEVTFHALTPDDIDAYIATREPLGMCSRMFARQVRFVDIGGANLVRDANERQQLAAARRLRGEDHVGWRHRSSQRVTGPSFTSSTSIIAPNSPLSV